MQLRINPEPPEIMHIDLNSAFAMAEQQANPLIRGKAVGITNRLAEHAICITASYEARRVGIGIGTRLREARWRSPGFVMLESDPAKYMHVNRLMRGIFESYSPVAYMKSVDEGIIDFRGMRGLLKGRSLEDIGQEIKQRVRDEVGDYMTVNVGIGQNRWLAKVVKMQAVGLKRALALGHTPHSRPDRIDNRKSQHQGSRRQLSAGVYGQHGQHQSQEVGAGVPHEDPRRDTEAQD